MFELLKILVVDDEKKITDQLAHFFRRKGFTVYEANSSKEAFSVLEKQPVSLVLLDYMLPGDLNGIEILKRIKSEYPDTEVIMVSGQEDIDVVIEAQRQGAIDFVRKPFSLSEIMFAIERTGKYVQLLQKLNHSENHLSLISRELETLIERDFIGQSPSIRKATELAMRVAADPDASVLITGENGTGKEILARIIHYASSRSKKPFVPVNSTAIPETLIESEFFGHKKGAFTDAKEDKKGFFELANGGTLFLDEIADMSPSLQAKLLRAMEERRISPIGSGKEIQVDIRIISATNKNLEQLIDEQKFRLDLYHRINTFTIHIPPLRERKEDIEPLLKHFVTALCMRKKRPVPVIDPQVITHLQSYYFPGNVRELRNLVERALIVSDGQRLTPDDFLIKKEIESKNEPLTYNLDENEKMLIEAALRRTGGNQIKAAELLGISRDALKHRLQKHRISILKIVDKT